MILCREAILDAYERGEIVIDPFDERLVNPNSVDVRFGGTLFRMKSTYGIRDLYNPSDELWEAVDPVPAEQIRAGGLTGCSRHRHGGRVRFLMMPRSSV